MSLDLSSLEAAIAQLEEALALHNSDIALNNPRIRRHLRAASIQAFEFTYELSFKLLKRHLSQASANPAEIDGLSFADIIRRAYGHGLLRSELKDWRKFRRNRGVTSHTYNEKKADEVFATLPDFLQESEFLLSRLQESNESRG